MSTPTLLDLATHHGDIDIDAFIVARNGGCTVRIAYRDQGDYVGDVTADGRTWTFEDLRPPQILTEGSPLQGGYDCEAALCHMAASAVSFADHFTSGRGGEEPAMEWNRYGEHFSSACYGDCDDDGPVFAVDGPDVTAHRALCEAEAFIDAASQGIIDVNAEGSVEALLIQIHDAKAAIEKTWETPVRERIEAALATVESCCLDDGTDRRRVVLALLAAL